MKDFEINSVNILHSDTNKTKFVYSRIYDRIYKKYGDVNHNNEPEDDSIPTIMVDTNGDEYDFKILKAYNVFEVLKTSDNFSYSEYSKNKDR